MGHARPSCPAVCLDHLPCGQAVGALLFHPRRLRRRQPALRHRRRARLLVRLDFGSQHTAHLCFWSLNGHTIADNCAAALRYEKGGPWPEHYYHLYEGMGTLTLQRTGDRTLLVTTPKGWFSSS